MKRNGGVLLITAIVAVGACEVVIHWLLGKGVFPRLLAIYFSADYPSGKHEFAWTLDNVAPAAILRWINGWPGFPRWSVRKLVATTLLLAVFVAVLVPAYSVLISPYPFAAVWGVPKTAFQGVFFHVYDVFGAFLMAGAFTYGAYVFRRDWKRGTQ